MNYKNPTIVEVHWLDSAGSSGWRHASENDYTPSKCRTAGYLIHKDRKTVTIALNMDDEGKSNNRVTIPRSVVQSITRLDKKKDDD